MTAPSLDVALQHYLRLAREALLWKLEGLSEYDVRRPMTPTGTNLLGLVKHVATTEAGYLGDAFNRPFAEPMPWIADDAEPNADMWATLGESRANIIDLYHRVGAHSEATLRALPLDAVGHVPWWGKHAAATLQQILVHLIAEINRHVGHADIVRELIDGQAGLRADDDNLAPGDEAWWVGYRQRLSDLAVEARGR